MVKKRSGWGRRILTLLRNVVLGLLVTLWIGLNPSTAGLKRFFPHLPSLSLGELAVLAITDGTHFAQQGRELYQAGQFAAAATAWDASAQAYQERGDELNQAKILSYLALAYQKLGQWTQANDAIAKSLKLLQSNLTQSNSGNPLLILAHALNTQGSLQFAQGQLETALGSWQQAAATYAQADDQAGQIGSLINQAQVQQALGFYLRARQTLAGVEQSLESQSDLQLKSTGLLSLGNVLRLLGEGDESRRVLQASLTAAQQSKSPSDLSAILLSLGNTARAQQDSEAALSFYQQAIAQSTSKITQIQSQLNQLSLLVAAERWSEVQTLLPQIQSEITNLPPSRPTVYAQINFAQTLMKMDRKRAEEQAEIPQSSANLQSTAQLLATATQQAKLLQDQRSLSLALGTLGEVYEDAQQWSDAQDLTQQALALSQGINASDISYRWQWQLGRLLNVQKDEPGAVAAYGEAVNTLQSLRSDLVAVNSEVQFSFRETVEPVYREFVSLLLQDKTSPERLEKARKVIESLQLAQLDNFFRSACLNASPVEIDKVDQQAAVIYPIILPDRLEVILSLPQQPLRHYATFLPQEQVESTLSNLYINLTQRLGQGYFQLSQTVYDWLIRPVETDLVASDVKTLVFVLDGALRNIPMAALYDGEQFLLEKYAVALTPGLELLDPKPLAQRPLKVLTAGLSAAREEFPALPNVELELNEIESLLPGELFLNQEFTQTNIQNALTQVSFPVVHLATHGQFSSNAEDTFILTWDARINVKDFNNLLQTRDLHGSEPIELLVLSACETAKGDNRATLGIAGVALRAGARSTLATLWSVSDEATAGLMGQFYQELARGSLTKAEALRRAQLSVLQDPTYRQHPYYWAPFVLVGNWL
ncbi:MULTISPECIES: CHAT domain-containing protein [unclassified Coleofasciculus]|uniref:CHAT domain-containing protein n=1 Tax=unclassified Coleofasciculus TaxID=2692782 RepID=UPI00187ED269|nr:MULTISPECIES: CHAT domain-containing protein [unclassified Coleofasciculus]MBE9127121.1 CHAT domain-containing protein [Coleofasciculus sp. LEGE 07081]MBE9149772.1 CHAT domain-containing protein [Coleofasciculus sp. LEGE 07092]